MKRLFEHSQHLVRLAMWAIAVAVIFLVVRAFAMPEGFGKFGHYRPGALDEERSHPIRFAGRRACEECHSEVAEKKAAGAHLKVACESCHGALAEHVAIQMEGKGGPAAKPKLPGGPELCLGCHRQLVGRPADFPQILPREHGDGGACGDCHVPHDPGLGEPATPGSSAAATPATDEKGASS